MYTEKPCELCGSTTRQRWESATFNIVICAPCFHDATAVMDRMGMGDKHWAVPAGIDIEAERKK